MESSAVTGSACASPEDQHRTSLLPGLLVVTLGVGGALLAHAFVGAVGVLTWAVGLGMLVANSGVLPAGAAPGIGLATKRLLRVGVALLGFSLSLGAIAALGTPVIGLVAATLVLTLVVTTWLGRRLAVGPARSLLIGTGFAICGASAVAAMQDTAEADEDDVAVAVGMVTVCGTLAMVALPLLQAPLGLTDQQFGAWAGASVHEVGQVVAAAGPAGAAAVGVAVVVKLLRVLLLAPVVAVLSASRRRTVPRDVRPPLVPLFVVAFLGCVCLRSTGWMSPWTLEVIGQVQQVTLAAALFGMGTAVRLRRLVRGSARVLTVSLISTFLVAGVSLAWVVVVV